MIGSLLNNRYRLDSEIGRGGMGTVFRASDTLLEREVAVKVVSDSALGTEGRSRLLHEARATASLNHPNIVAVHDVGQVQEENHTNAFIVMELVDGPNLANYQAQDLAEIIDIIKQVGGALDAAHKQGIIHRDIKPENMLVSRPGEVKLMDFGLAQVAGQSRLTQEGTLMGTLTYLAPEIILGRQASPQSDLYALGVMFYEMVAQRLPFTGDGPTAILSQHIYATVVPPSTHQNNIPPALDRLIIQMLRKQPEDRPASAAAFTQTLQTMVLDVGVLDPGPVSSNLDRLARGRLVGREQEYRQSIAAWNKVAARQGQVLLVSGEPGIGKTRFVRELATHVEVSGGQLLSGECYQQGVVPYLPISQVIRQALSDKRQFVLDDAVIADLLTLVPDLRRQFPRAEPDRPFDSVPEQASLYESIVHLCQALMAQGPLMLLVDDLHWADSGTLSLLRYLVRRADHNPLFLVGTYREVELSESRPALEMLRNISRENRTSRIKLTRLSAQQTSQMLSILFGEEADQEFSQAIYHETEGNPFFVEEVSRALIEEGNIYFANGRWHQSPTARLEVPQGVQLAIESRLDRLDDKTLAVLRVAALLGREFRYQLLVSAINLPEEQLIDALDYAESTQLIEELRTIGSRLNNPSFSFTHALIQSTLLNNLSTLRRQRLQRQVALNLEEAYPEALNELAPLLGRYFAEAGDGEKAIAYLLKSGDSARLLFAYQEAAEAYELALVYLREWDDPELTAQTLMKLGLTYHVSFHFEKARQAHDEAFAIRRLAGSLPSPATLPDAAQALRIAAFSPASLDPALAATAESETVIQHLYAGLVIQLPDGVIEPDVAARWELQDNGRRYVFYLRPDLYWSDGYPVTANDFEFAWKRALDPVFGEYPANLFYDIVGARAFNRRQATDPSTIGINALDERTLTIDLEAPATYFLQILARGFAAPVPKHVVVDPSRDWTDPNQCVTNGPFKIEYWKQGETTRLERFAGYKGPVLGNVTTIELTNRDISELPELYKADELDFISIDHLSDSELSQIMQRHPTEYTTGPFPSTGHIWFDITRSPFDDARVRRAIALAIDREYLVQICTHGHYFPATGGFVPPGIPGHIPDLYKSPDPGQARKLLAAAGFPEGAGFPRADLVTVEGSPILQCTAEELSRQLQNSLAIDVNIKFLPQDEFRDTWLNEPPHIWLLGWQADYPDADNFLRGASWLSISRWRNKRYEQLVEEARRVSESSERFAMYREAEQILDQEAPLVPLYYLRYFLLAKPWLRNLIMPANGTIMAQHLTIIAHD